jgi:serine/threonine protein phosphatase PrpC
MELVHASLTDPGIGRARNEDAFIAAPELGLFAVCDGVGGRAGGQEASNTAAGAVREVILNGSRVLDSYLLSKQGSGNLSRRDVATLLEGAVQRASQVVHQRAAEAPEFSGMATTIASILIVDDHAFVAHVGDSRVYLMRSGALHLLTEDHSLLNELRRRGRVTEREQHAAFRGALTRAVGVMETVRVDLLDLDLLPGDRFLVCSDGIHGVVPDQDIQAILVRGDPHESVQALVDAALQRGGPDNATCIVIDVVDDRAADRAYRVRLRLEALQALSFFRYLPFSDLVRVAGIAIERTFASGDALMREGELDDTLYVLLEGTVAVIKGDVEIAVLEPGAQFGEMSLIDREVRSASVVARKAGSLLVIRREDFFNLLREEATAVKLLWGMLRVLSQRLRSTSEELSQVKSAAMTTMGFDTTQDMPIPIPRVR